MKVHKLEAPAWFKPSKAQRFISWIKGRKDENLLCLNVLLIGYRREMERFRVLPLDQLRALPVPAHLLQYPGVYFLWMQSALVYVGKSKNVYTRVSQHRLSGKSFTHATFLHVSGDLCGAFERIYISRYRPCDNVLL